MFIWTYLDCEGVIFHNNKVKYSFFTDLWHDVIVLEDKKEFVSSNRPQFSWVLENIKHFLILPSSYVC